MHAIKALKGWERRLGKSIIFLIISSIIKSYYHYHYHYHYLNFISRYKVISVVVGKIKECLKVKPAFGYALTMNYEQYYHLHTEGNPFYKQMCEYGPCIYTNNSSMKA